MHHFNVIPECYADTLLVNMLGFGKANHALNSNLHNVLAQVRSKKPGQKVVGIIDSDKGRSEKLLKEFEFISEEENIKKYLQGTQTILVLCPVFETWIYEAALHQSVNINPENFGFTSKEYFRKKCKKVQAKDDPSLKQFFNALKQKEAPGFIKLQSWICDAIGIQPDQL